MFSREDGCPAGAVRLLRVIGEEAAFYWCGLLPLLLSLAVAGEQKVPYC